MDNELLTICKLLANDYVANEIKYSVLAAQLCENGSWLLTVHSNQEAKTEAVHEDDK